MFTIGTTFLGRPIRAIEISNDPNGPEDEPAIQFNSQHHAREVATSHVVVDVIHTLTDGYGVDPMMTEWVDAMTERADATADWSRCHIRPDRCQGRRAPTP